MSEILQDIFNGIDNLRATLRKVKVSEKIKSEVEDLLKPFFSDPEQCQRITDAINDFGDFTENILVPLLEQYVSAEAAVRVKFIVEDILVAMEGYRDQMLKKIAKEKKKKLASAQVPNMTTTSGVLSFNSSTNHYRQALHQADNKNKHKKQATPMSPRYAFGKYQLARASQRKLGSGFKSTQVNTSMSVDDTVKAYSSKVEKKKVTMAGIGYTKTGSSSRATLAEAVNFEIPNMKKSGQVKIRVTAVGLNHFDYKKLEKMSGGVSGKLKQLGSFAELGNSLLAIGDAIIPKDNASSGNQGKTSGAAAGSGTGMPTGSPVQPQQNSSDGKSLIGVEFCGVVEDIAWTKGDYLHRLHVSRDDVVIGIIRDPTVLAKQKWQSKRSNIQNEAENTNSKGALAEYVICDVNDVIRCPRHLNPYKAASLPLDASLVVRTLAETDMGPGSVALVVGGATSAGLILLELLSKDLKLPWSNIYVMSTPGQTNALTQAGVLASNIYDYNDDKAITSMGDGLFDVIFDCLSETDFTGLGNKPNLEKQLEKKKKKTSGQYFTLDSTKLLAEKLSRNENWQKELKLISKLSNEKKLMLNLVSRSNVQGRKIEFAEDDVGEALKELRAAQNIGKFVVGIDKQKVKAMAARLSN